MGIETKQVIIKLAQPTKESPVYCSFICCIVLAYICKLHELVGTINCLKKTVFIGILCEVLKEMRQLFEGFETFWHIIKLFFLHLFNNKLIIWEILIKKLTSNSIFPGWLISLISRSYLKLIISVMIYSGHKHSHNVDQVKVLIDRFICVNSLFTLLFYCSFIN